jgi:hypothetical protein
MLATTVDLPKRASTFWDLPELDMENVILNGAPDGVVQVEDVISMRSAVPSSPVSITVVPSLRRAVLPDMLAEREEYDE